MVSDTSFPDRSAEQTTAALLEQRAATYERLAPSYHADRFGSPPGRYDFEETRALVGDLVTSLLGERTGEWVALDLACGTGKVTLALAAAGGRVVALDAAMAMLEQCARRVGAVRGRVRFTRASAGHLPYKDNSFDVVLASRFLHLFPVEAYGDLLREMARVTKPGGHVVVEMKNQWYGGMIYWAKERRAGRPGSSYVTPGRARRLAGEVGGIQFRSMRGLLLPKGWWLMERPRLARLARTLANGPLMAVSAHLVAIYRKD